MGLVIGMVCAFEIICYMFLEIYCLCSGVNVGSY